MDIKKYLLQRYEELHRKESQASNKSEYELIFHMKLEVARVIINCNIMDEYELQRFRDTINEIIILERQGH